MSTEMADPKDPDFPITGFIINRINPAQPVLHFCVQFLQGHSVERGMRLLEVVRGKRVTLEIDGNVV